MTISTRLPLIAASIILVISVSACEKNPAENAGKSIDQAVEKTGDKIQAASDKLDEQSDKVALVIDDSAVTAKVKSALLAQAGFQVFQINVDTVNGVTTLTGAVDTQVNLDHAAAVARRVEGVSQVENKLTIKSAQ